MSYAVYHIDDILPLALVLQGIINSRNAPAYTDYFLSLNLAILFQQSHVCTIEMRLLGPYKYPRVSEK
jgi:hypothetical protein